MTGRDLFGVVVRAIGIMFVVFGLFDLVHVGLSFAGRDVMNQHPADILIAAVISYIVVGLTFLIFARRFVRLCYGPPGSPGD